MSKIKLTDNTMDVLIKMSDGSTEALTALMEIMQCKADPQNILGGLGHILSLDDMGIYGTDIYVLWSDICNKNTVLLLAVLRAVQLGLFSRETVIDASSRQDYSGKSMIPVQKLYDKVKERLTEFDRH